MEALDRMVSPDRLIKNDELMLAILRRRERLIKLETARNNQRRINER